MSCRANHVQLIDDEAGRIDRRYDRATHQVDGLLILVANAMVFAWKRVFRFVSTAQPSSFEKSSCARLGVMVGMIPRPATLARSAAMML